MEVIHIGNQGNGYEIVRLISNGVSKNNELAVIERDGEKLMTGGVLIKNTPEVVSFLNSLPKEKHYEFIKSIKRTPLV